MTNRVDRLVARGAVTRENDPSDGRAVRVRLTGDGLALVDAAFESLLAMEEELLAKWTHGDRARLADYLRVLLESSA